MKKVLVCCILLISLMLCGSAGATQSKCDTILNIKGVDNMETSKILMKWGMCKAIDDLIKEDISLLMKHQAIQISGGPYKKDVLEILGDKNPRTSKQLLILRENEGYTYYTSSICTILESRISTGTKELNDFIHLAVISLSK